jgi:predicted site-specific integrase-resolvase
MKLCTTILKMLLLLIKIDLLGYLFSILEHIFEKFGTKIIIINKPDKYFDNEYFNDLLTLMHSFSTKFYSKRKKHKKTYKKK